MISKDRNRQLKEFAKQRLACHADPEARKLALKSLAGTATPAEKRRLDRLRKNPDVSGERVILFLDSEQEAERVRALVAEETGRRMAPDAVRGHKQKKTCVKNAAKGGKATAHYSDADVTQAFTRFRMDNPGKSLWDACNALIRTGRPLDNWKNVNSAYNRTKHIACNRYGITAQAWFDAL